MISIKKLPTNRWKDFRDLRLESLKSEPVAFSSSYEKEREFGSKIWRKRIRNYVFAMEDEKPIGVIGIVFGEEDKERHIANLVGMHVNKNYRGRGVGGKLIKQALKEAGKNKDVIKAELWVNTEQKEAVRLYKKNGFAVVGRTKKALRFGEKFGSVLI